MFNWGKEENVAFDKLKSELASCVSLTYLNTEDPVLLKTDASLIGVAGILIQEQERKLKIVACVSRHLSPAEKNYSPMEIEAFAIIYSLNKFRHYLLGRHFKIITDHSAPKVLNSRTARNARVERWALALSEYVYEIIHRKGKLHEDVDCLSRAPVDPPEEIDHLESVYSITIVPPYPDDWTNAYTDVEAINFKEKAEHEEEDFALKNNLIYKNDRL